MQKNKTTYYIDKRPMSFVTEKISCPKCTSTNIYPHKKWIWDHSCKEIILTSDWACKTCKLNFEGDELE